MTQENKDLLLRDLCARLPYSIRCLVSTKVRTYTGIIESIGLDESIEIIKDNDEFISCADIINCKPYLFPLSSMTEEQKRELNILSEKECKIIEDVVNNPTPSNVGFPVVVHYMIDWCNKNHFDIRGLIPMGLAIDATGLNIY